MKNKCFLSVITVVLNNCSTLQRTIDSVKNQNFTKMEHIIIDGGSTDGTKGIIEKNNKYLNYWVSEKDKGIYDAMNKGIKKSAGEWLLFLNSDDFLIEGVINEIFTYNNLDEYDVFYGSMIYLGTGYRIKVKKRNLNNLERPLSYSHPTTFYKKSFIEKFDGYNKKYKICGDYDLFLRMAKAKYKVMFIDKLVSVMTAGGIGERLGSVFIIIRERFYTDSSNFGLKKALKNLIFFTIPCYTKLFIKKLLVAMGLNKIVSIYFKIKYPEK